MENGEQQMICCPQTWADVNQGKVKKTKKFALVKRMLNPNDIRLQVSIKFQEGIPTLIRMFRKENQAKQQKKEQDLKEKAVRRVYAAIQPLNSLTFLFDFLVPQ